MNQNMGILGQKIGMTQVFGWEGERVPVTVVRAGPCVVMARRTPERNGYAAVQLGFGDKPQRLARRPEAGAAAKANTPPKRLVREIRLVDASGYEVGQTVAVGDVIREGDRVDVAGTSKGKGFQGVVRRYHFKGNRATHGTHEYRRHPGSIGCRLTPGRVHKGKRMGGHMGHRRVSVQNLEVVRVVADENLLLLRGAVPGPNGGYLIVRGTVKRRRAGAPAAA